MLNKILFATAAAVAPMVVATPAMAQKLPSPVVAVVDVERVMSDCNACKTATAQLDGQLASLRSMAQQLGQPLQAEAQSLDAALQAAKGKPDAALQQRVGAFQDKQQNAQRQVQQQEGVYQRNVQYVRFQIAQALGPVIDQVAQQRGATLVVDKGAVLYSAQSIDITDSVMAGLNGKLTTINTVAPPPQQQGQAQPGQPQQSQPQPQQTPGR